MLPLTSASAGGDIQSVLQALNPDAMDPEGEWWAKIHSPFSIFGTDPLKWHPILPMKGAVVPWLNWIEQPPPKGQVAGSNPAGVTTFYLFFNMLENSSVAVFARIRGF